MIILDKKQLNNQYIPIFYETEKQIGTKPFSLLYEAYG